ncbi:DUF5615 family PIN-like protein [Sorangium sp. So ce1153]|uniref:DUF5615 family PIN-like protein n=1 Tax=Sorangium sp. So ce1153 TaxID=3133333 RepID=UPI003F635FBE
MILADENIAVSILERLRADGVTVLHVAEIAPTISDGEVLRLAAERDAIVLTDDKDFGELIVREGHAHRGVVLLRLAGVPYPKRAEMVSALFRECSAELEGAFTVLSADGRVRIRKLSPKQGT